MKYIKIIEEVDFAILVKAYWKSQKEVNLSMNFSTGSTNAFVKLVDFLGRKLISYHTILSTAILVVKELFGMSSCHNLNHSAKNFLKAPGRVLRWKRIWHQIK